MAFTAAKDSGRAMLMEYTPPTPPLTPKKNQLLKPAISWQSPLIESTRNHLEERLVKNEEFSAKSMQSKSKETASADSIVPKRFAAAPPTILLPPVHLLSSEVSDSETTMVDEENPMRTFKLQDPPKGKVKAVSKKCSSRDESDSVFKSSEPASPSRAKCQTSITQYMFPASHQLPSGQYKSKIISSPHHSYKTAQSPCTPSKRARSNDSTDDETLFVFPSVPRNNTVRIPTSPLASPSPNWKKYRKRSMDGHFFSDTEVADDFLELNMSSPPLVQFDPMFYGRGRNSDEATDVSPRLEKNIDYRNMTHFHENSQMEKDNSVSSRYERLSCEEASSHKNCSLHKLCNSSPVCHQELSSPACGFCHYESVSVDQDPNFVPYPTTPVKREEVDGESYFEAVSCSMKNKTKNGPGIIHDKVCEEHCQQNIHYNWPRPFKHSISELVPSEFNHKPECALPESFPFVSTFKSAYDEQGIYRRDESCCAWPTKDDDRPGKILCRRVSNKESIREREYLHDERYWIYMKNCTKDYAASHTMSSHSEENPTSSIRTSTSCNVHPDSPLFSQSSRIASQHPPTSPTHIARSPVPMKLTSPTLKSRFSVSPSSKLQQFHLSKSPMSEKYLESSPNSSAFLEHCAAESNSLSRRKSPVQSPSGSNMKTFIFPSKHCPRSHASTLNAPWSSTCLNPSFHSRYQYRTSPSSSKWQDEEHGIPNGLARRRLFCKSDASQESIISSKEEETKKILHCCHCADQSHLLGYSGADSMLTLEKTVNRFIPGHCDEAREPCECYERARPHQSYKKCLCLQNHQISDDLE